MAENWLKRAQTEGTPIIEGSRAVFVWAGEHAPVIKGDFNDWGAEPGLPFRQVEPGVWLTELVLSEDAYIEYAFDAGEKNLLDPNNPRTIFNGMDQYNNYFYMPKGKSTPLIRRSKGVPAGKLTTLKLPAQPHAIGKTRQVVFYQPPVTQPVPLLVVLDGRDYLRRARLPVIVDHLIAQGRMQPVALAMVYNGGEARTVEYFSSESLLFFLLGTVIPAAAAQLNLQDVRVNPGSYGIMGASLGGLAALTLALRAPNIFGSALCQSGAYHLRDHDLIVMDLVRYTPVPPVNLWLDCGLYEYLLVGNRKMQILLAERGYSYCYHEYPGGHNYTAWRNDVWRGLEYLFGR
jgi:enterochelin esterase-like enzyme